MGRSEARPRNAIWDHAAYRKASPESVGLSLGAASGADEMSFNKRKDHVAIVSGHTSGNVFHVDGDRMKLDFKR